MRANSIIRWILLSLSVLARSTTASKGAPAELIRLNPEPASISLSLYFSSLISPCLISFLSDPQGCLFCFLFNSPYESLPLLSLDSQVSYGSPKHLSHKASTSYFKGHAPSSPALFLASICKRLVFCSLALMCLF